MSDNTRDVHVKKQLSSKIKSMKFMHKQEERLIRQRLEEDQKKEALEAEWVLFLPDNQLDKKFEFSKIVEIILLFVLSDFKVEYDTSFMSFSTSDISIGGRKSYRNFNKDIQKLNANTESNFKQTKSRLRESADEVSNLNTTDF
ncbi:hypothetical protein HDU92_001318, partial [Lobulomyces angularis]